MHALVSKVLCSDYTGFLLLLLLLLRLVALVGTTARRTSTCCRCRTTSCKCTSSRMSRTSSISRFVLVLVLVSQSKVFYLTLSRTRHFLMPSSSRERSCLVPRKWMAASSPTHIGVVLLFICLLYACCLGQDLQSTINSMFGVGKTTLVRF